MSELAERREVRISPLDPVIDDEPDKYPSADETAKYPGAPQAAAKESIESEGEVDMGAINEANRRRHTRLPLTMPDDYGGGTMWLRASTSQRVMKATEDYDNALRAHPWVKSKFRPGVVLTGKAGTESNRNTTVMCIMGWEPKKTLKFPVMEEGAPKRDANEEPIHIRYTPAQVAGMGLKEVREYVTEEFLPAMDMGSPKEVEDEINYEFFLLLLGAMREASEVPASEIARLGEDFRLGAVGVEDLDG